MPYHTGKGATHKMPDGSMMAGAKHMGPLTKLMNSPMSPMKPMGAAAMKAAPSPSAFIRTAGSKKVNEEKQRQEARLAKLKGR